MERRWPESVLLALVLVSIVATAMPARAVESSRIDADRAIASGEADQAPATHDDAGAAPASSPASATPETDSTENSSDDGAKGSQAREVSRQSGGESDPDAKAGGRSDAADSADKRADFSFEQVIAKARTRADHSYQAPPGIPKFLQNLGYQGLDQIQYKKQDAIWARQNLAFQIMLYHPGSYYRHAVKIDIVDANGQVKPLAFDKNRFDYANEKLRKKVPDDLGYAGFKVLHELNHPGKLDEILSFLGASYFRALGADEHYGLSARGLAIDTGSSNGEEFPDFVRFWLVKPAAGAGPKKMTLYALLDSPSVAGAYKFIVTPGDATQTHVKEVLFTRKAIDKLGIAPLTSMFTWGENSLARIDDYRPEAHDSDGMVVSQANGEWIWRPLVDPQTLWMNQFNAENVHGFGLSQRDRNFDHYQDLDYEYQRRPSAWITPEGNWGKGHLELVEIPSDSEVNDNIALYWVPEKPVEDDQKLVFSYNIRWSNRLAVPASLGHVVATRVGIAAVNPGQSRDQVQVAIDFAGGALNHLKDPNTVQPHVSAMRDATINNIQAVPNPYTGGWRLSFLVPINALDKPLDLRAYLSDANGGGLTETWLYSLKTP